ncbi:MAG: hypothetical protein AAGJ08_24320 [Cyanobacteria bacterium P01_H01_bin.35]
MAILYPKKFEEALKIIKSIFELINLLKQQYIDKKTYYTKVLVDYESIQGKNFQSSLNQIKDKNLKRSTINIIFNKVNPKDWQEERIHYGKSDHLEVFDKTGKNYIGESDLEGNIDGAKSDKKKSV